MKEVAAGIAANTDPVTGYSQKACDYTGTAADANAINNALIVRKYTSSTNAGISHSTSWNDSAYAALNVDTDESPGIRSVGINHFGAIAQTVIESSYITATEKGYINKNRVGVVVMTNSSNSGEIYLPTSPMPGQTFTVIRHSGTVTCKTSSNIIVVVGSSTLTNNVAIGNVGAWARFLWDGKAWNCELSRY